MAQNLVSKWHKQKLNVVLQQKRQLVQEKEMQQQKKVLKAERGNVRINFFFLKFCDYEI